MSINVNSKIFEVLQNFYFLETFSKKLLKSCKIVKKKNNQLEIFSRLNTGGNKMGSTGAFVLAGIGLGSHGEGVPVTAHSAHFNQ